ncbi:hypothetical protein [Kitasatospora sp. NBC_00458]
MTRTATDAEDEPPAEAAPRKRRSFLDRLAEGRLPDLTGPADDSG